MQEMRQAPVASAQTVHARVGKDNHRVLPGLWHTEEDIAQFKKLKDAAYHRCDIHYLEIQLCPRPRREGERHDGHPSH